ncbi:hypothetical protein SAPIO_CDS1119 [Scedosporium apiospermum]|uniref:Nephrocystin 3-like N-terminal domain-containing protein n=1 Tax=Pseudallescheria apiosperma TaxID=563466 RepID=A0A084GFW8_PSEDA|nr:uncharacterized protein SAPIO_CDS1119 [Scedosporium apiospermum]KEZ46230.1 hypothetical protein SAPIO_CDS1119 [Scedosporium apiospermum]
MGNRGNEDQHVRVPRVEVQDEGFTILHDFPHAVADIVLIHGLQGHPKKTWYYGDYEDPRKSKPSVFSRFHREVDRDKDCFWPEDLLPRDFANCRIMTYGYDSHVSHFFAGAANQGTITDHATSLLHDLCGRRTTHSCRRRAIVWVAHSLGGLLLKEVLRLSWQAPGEELHEVYQQTIATLFLGTPHRGSDLAEWGLMLKAAANAILFDTNRSILRQLKVDSVILDRLIDDFARVYEQSKFDVYTFREGKRLDIGLITMDKVVRDSSARIGYGREQIDMINADHRHMCRFSGFKDNGYLKVFNALSKSIKTKAVPEYARDEKYMQAIRDLPAPETQLRYDQVEPALEGTFEWLFTKESLGFEAWLRSDNPLYWIRGKPASGKSTLMKMALKDPRTAAALERSDTKCSTASFFFHDRGAYIQKSFEGLLRAILDKILSDIPELMGSVYESFRGETDRINFQRFRWTTDFLIAAFDSILQQRNLAASISLFLDALDEYAGDRAHIVEFLQALTKKRKSSVTLKICFSSRMEQVFLDKLSDLPGFHIHEHTDGDISLLVNAKFAANGRMQRCLENGTDKEKEAAQKLKSKILSLAQGVFLWIKLILDELLPEFTDGKSLSDLHKTLDTVPTDLHEFYQYIVEKRINPKYMEESSIVFELVRFDEMYRFVRSRSGNLVEIRHSSGHCGGELWQPSQLDATDTNLASYNVQFLHQSVKTFAGKRSAVNLAAQVPQKRNGFLYLLKLEVVVEIDKETAEHEIPEIVDLVGFATLAELPRTLEDLLRTANPQDSQRCLQSFCRYYLHRGPMSKETSNMVLKELLKYSSNRKALAVIKDLIYAPHSARHRDSYSGRLLLAAGVDSNKFRFRGYFHGVSLLLQQFFENGIKVSTPIPTRWLDPTDGHYWPSWTLMLHVAASHWSTRELVDAVLGAKGVDINALDGKGHTTLDYALYSYGFSVRTVFKTQKGDDKSDHDFDQYTDREWYNERFNVATRLIDRGAKVSGLYKNPHRLKSTDLDQLLLIRLPIDTRLLFPPTLAGGAVADAILENPIDDEWWDMMRKKIKERLIYYIGGNKTESVSELHDSGQ